MPRRRLFNILSFVSLLVCVAVAVLWVRSYFVADHLTKWSFTEGHDEIAVTSFTISSWSGDIDSEIGRGVCPNTPLRAKEIRETTGKANKWRWWTGSVPSGRAPAGTSPGSLCPVWVERLGFYVCHIVDPPTASDSGSVLCIDLPHWFPCLLTAILPLLWLKRALRCRRAKRLGLCTQCGYDLRASPDRCPECGTIPAPKADNTPRRTNH